MNKISCKTASAITIVLLVVLLAAGQVKAAGEERKEVTVVFTHDIHSHLEPVISGGKETGGAARIKTVFDRLKSEKQNTLIVDGGDFSMGTLYQSMYMQRAYEFTMLGYLGVEAVTLGNHEFDYGGTGAAQMLKAGKAAADANPELKLPHMLISNINWEESTKESREALTEAFSLLYGGKEYNYEYTLIEKGGIRILLYGLMGEDSAACAPDSGLIFDDIIEVSQKLVPKLKEELQADMAVCLSHSGTWEKKSESEDEQLADAVPELDLIISGHTHTTLDEPVVSKNKTYVASAGCYGNTVGTATMVQNPEGGWDMEAYELIPIDESVVPDPDIERLTASYKEEVNREFLAGFGYTFDQVLAYNPYNMETVDEVYAADGETVLGNFIADSYVYAVKEAEGDAYREIAMAVVPTGVIRETLSEGEVTAADAFSVASLGIGKDGLAGNPLIDCYLTGEELKTAAEVDASVSVIMPAAGLHTNGLGFAFNPNRLLLNRVTDTWLEKEDGTKEEIEDKTLYRVVSGLYTAKMLGEVEDKSFGLMSLVPKDEVGNPVTDFESRIIYNGTSEVKEWTAVAGYLESLGTVPEYYGTLHGRKVVDNTKSLLVLIKNPNKIAFILAGGIIVLIVLIVAIILIIRKIKKTGNLRNINKK